MKKDVKIYILLISLLLVLSFLGFYFVRKLNSSDNEDSETTQALENERLEYYGEKTLTFEEMEKTYLAFKNCNAEASDCDYYLIQKDSYSMPLDIENSNEGKEFFLSGTAGFMKTKANIKYWNIIKLSSIFALTEYNGIFRDPLDEYIGFYSFKSCSQEYSNCKYYLITPSDLSDSQLDTLETIEIGDQVKISGKELEIEGAAGSLYVELTDQIQIEK